MLNVKTQTLICLALSIEHCVLAWISPRLARSHCLEETYDPKPTRLADWNQRGDGCRLAVAPARDVTPDGVRNVRSRRNDRSQRAGADGARRRPDINEKIVRPIRRAVVRPFLKWAGGKRQLLPRLSLYYPATFDGYVEPFLGSGAVFFDLHRLGRLRGRRVTLADGNPDLIGCYQMVRDHTDAVIAHLEQLESEHRRRADVFYYEVRDQRFNPQRQKLTPDPCPLSPSYTPELAAMFIYLNRTGFNGLFRLNRAGAFNVPAGRYVNPRICDGDNLRAAAAALQMPKLTLSVAAFERTLARADAGDFVYCDPPYAPLSRTSLFAHYTAGGFTLDDHRRLQEAVVRAAQRGAAIVLSNSNAREIVDLYARPKAGAARLRIERVPARRAINSRASRRGPIDELIITNAKLRMAKRQPSKRACGSLDRQTPAASRIQR